jgi:hypothetical protein
MQAWFRSVLAFFACAAGVLTGCTGQQPKANTPAQGKDAVTSVAHMDVVLNVPGMH